MSAGPARPGVELPFKDAPTGPMLSHPDMPLTAMDEIEITEIPPLSPGEQSIVDFHSIVNVVNVLNCELIALGLEVADDDCLFREGLAVCDGLVASFHDRALALRLATEVETMEDHVLDELDRKLAGRPVPGERIVETMGNIRSVFEILKVRARELLARAAAPERWDLFELERLRRDFVDMFAAIERNSRGRYRILYNAALQQAHDYYIDFKIESDAGATIALPLVLPEVMRDLIANARKYTNPGGHITAALHSRGDGLRFVVRDDGRGIPPDEIRQVVAFGKRASNVAAVRTMGGGFGLTKAFLATKQFGGRFWIASELDHGTQIRLWLPRPA